VSGELLLEQRYRRVLRLLPGYYRERWEEDMVAAFLDSWLTGDPDTDECVLEFCKPAWQEVASVVLLAARLYLGGRRHNLNQDEAMTQQTGPTVRRFGRRPARAGFVLAAISLSVAGCSQALPLGPTPPTQHHLSSAIVLQIVVSRPSSSAGSCPAGYARLPKAAWKFPGSPGSGQCYRRLGKPLTITSAAVTYFQQPAANQRPANYGVMITVPAADNAALLAITTKAYHSRARDQMAIIVAGKTWGVPTVVNPFTGGFEIQAQNANQALQLQRTLIPSA
jgi:hypothetical protein